MSGGKTITGRPGADGWMNAAKRDSNGYLHGKRWWAKRDAAVAKRNKMVQEAANRIVATRNARAQSRAEGGVEGAAIPANVNIAGGNNKPNANAAEGRIINGKWYTSGQAPKVRTAQTPQQPTDPVQAAIKLSEAFLSGQGDLTPEEVAALRSDSKQVGAPSYLGLAANMTNAQKRSAIAARAMAGDDPRYKDPETLAYYRQLALEDQGDDGGNIAFSNAEQQYLNSGYRARAPSSNNGQVNSNSLLSSIERVYRGIN